MEESSEIAGALKHKTAAKKMEESSKIAGASKHKTVSEKMGESNERAAALKRLNEIPKSTIKPSKSCTKVNPLDPRAREEDTVLSEGELRSM